MSTFRLWRKPTKQWRIYSFVRHEYFKVPWFSLLADDLYDECKAEFHFLMTDIHLLKDVLQVPNEVVCYSRLVFDGIEALCVLLKRFGFWKVPPILFTKVNPIRQLNWERPPRLILQPYLDNYSIFWLIKGA